jgi:hypothetical protein
MQWGSAGVTGFQAGLAAARRVFEDPQTAYQQQYFRTRVAEYALLWAYYNNSMFDKSIGYLNNWTTYRTFALYKSNYNLYRNIRLIYNPTRRLVDFYAGAIYPGVLSEDGDDLPDGVPLAVPFAEDTDDALKDAIAQFWQWSNWQSKKAVQVRYGAALGSVLIEICDDLDRGKVTAEVVWPGFVTNLRLDSAGNVKSYWLEYLARDQQRAHIPIEKKWTLTRSDTSKTTNHLTTVKQVQGRLSRTHTALSQRCGLKTLMSVEIMAQRLYQAQWEKLMN